MKRNDFHHLIAQVGFRCCCRCCFPFSVSKADADQRSRKDFMLEASIMGQFCDPNVIFLEGVVTKSESVEI